MMASLRDFEQIVRESVPLAPYTWFKLGGSAEYMAEPHSIDELAALVRRCRDEEMPVRVLGSGSNVLVGDQDVPGMVLKLSDAAFSEIKAQPPVLVAGGGASLGHLVSAAVRAGLAGLEPLVGIPGTVGGALHGNAEARGSDVGQWTCRATVLTRVGEIVQRQREDLVFAYRQSSLNELVILQAEFQLEQDDPEQLTKRMQKAWIVKKASQPMAHEATGRIFKNPRGMSASELLEQASLKGIQQGPVEVSRQHPNFIISHAGATSRHVLELIETMRCRVADYVGVELETEIEVW